MKRSLSQRCALAVLAGMIAASAAHANQGSGALFQRFDRNSDGQITRAEAKETLAQRFTRMDSDRDGAVTRAERKADRKARQFKQMDTNGDGRVSLPEMEASTLNRIQDRFTRLDANGDGALSLVEVQSRGNQRASREPMTLQDLDARVMRMFDRADQNRDGVITPDETSLMRPNG